MPPRRELLPTGADATGLRLHYTPGDSPANFAVGQSRGGFMWETSLCQNFLIGVVGVRACSPELAAVQLGTGSLNRVGSSMHPNGLPAVLRNDRRATMLAIRGSGLPHRLRVPDSARRRWTCSASYRLGSPAVCGWKLATSSGRPVCAASAIVR